MGDSAYPCLKTLMVPYRDNGHLSRNEITFNTSLGSCRVAIEHSFGILKQRFRQLYYCKLRSMKILCHFIRACVVLHNLSNIDDFLWELEITSNDFTENMNVGNCSENGKSLRDQICLLINSN